MYAIVFTLLIAVALLLFIKGVSAKRTMHTVAGIVIGLLTFFFF